MTTPTSALSVDVLALLHTGLTSQLPSTRIVTRLPGTVNGVDTLAASLPLVRVTRSGGPDDNIALDIPTLTLDCFTADYQTSYTLGLNLWAAIRALRGKVINGAIVTQCRKLSGPFWVDYENPAVQRHILLVQLWVKAD